MTIESPTVSPVGHVQFSRKVKIRDYESAEASVFIQFDVDTNDPDQTVARAKSAMFQAKALVFEELGLAFSVSDTGVIHEIVQNHFGKVTEVTSTVASPSTTTNAEPTIPLADGPETSDTPPYAVDTPDKNERAINKKWALDRIRTNPEEWWDNRENKKNPKGPDYKHKQNGMGVWLS